MCICSVTTENPTRPLVLDIVPPLHLQARLRTGTGSPAVMLPQPMSDPMLFVKGI